jgi:hypothetical protein
LLLLSYVHFEQPHHVPEQLQCCQSLRAALVLEQHIDERRAAVELHLVQDVRVRLRKAWLDEACPLQAERRPIALRYQIGRQHCTQLLASVLEVCEGVFDQMVVFLVRH